MPLEIIVTFWDVWTIGLLLLAGLIVFGAFCAHRWKQRRKGGGG